MPSAVKRARLTAENVFQWLFSLGYEEGGWKRGIESIRLDVGDTALD